MKKLINNINSFLASNSSIDRFFCFETKKFILIYDSYINNFYKFQKNKLKKIDLFCNTDNNKKFLELLKSLIKQKKSDTEVYTDVSFLHVKLALSNICNLNCSYCFVDKTIKQKIDIAQMQKILDEIIKKYSFQYSNICITYNIISEVLTDITALDFFLTYVEENNVYKYTKNDLNEIELNQILPKELLSQKKKNEEFIDFINRIITYKDLYKYIPDFRTKLQTASEWQKEKFAKIESLNNWELTGFNIDLLKHYIKKDSTEIFFLPQNAYISTYFQTNATLISNEIIELLKHHNINYVSLSLDYKKKINDKQRIYINGKSTFQDVISAIKLLKKEGFKVIVYSTITDNNCNVYNVFKFLKKLGIDEMGFNLVKNQSFTPKNYKILTKSSIKLLNYVVNQMKKGIQYDYNLIKDTYIVYPLKILKDRSKASTCCYGKKQVIDSKGNIYPCDYFINSNHMEGNIFLNNYQPEECPSVDSRVECKDCRFKNLCGGQCLVTRTTYCNLTKEIIKETLRIYGNLLTAKE
jgi:radical SAM protein with 4Fe4S-binding SPASM domain